MLLLLLRLDACFLQGVGLTLLTSQRKTGAAHGALIHLMFELLGLLSSDLITLALLLRRGQRLR